MAMEFVHRPYVAGQTVAAIATAPGEAGIAIIRLSGNEALDIACRIFTKDLTRVQSHTVHYGKIIWQSEVIDDVLAVVMKGPRSFTGEDTVEIHCHGGRLIPKRILEVCLLAGARAASPGEFSFKAFMNGKLDLAQAEGIQAKIGAKNELALQSAAEQLEGRLSDRVRTFQKQLTDIAAIFEAWVDFPEEGLEFAPFEEVLQTLQVIDSEIKRLIATFEQGKIMHQGISVSLVGSPNVGKSSLMNALLGRERAIVSPIAGTTRDLVEDDLSLGSLHLRLVDTAGIRETTEVIEEEGIRRSKLALERADIILYVLDVTKPVELELSLPNEKTIAIWNKIDLEHTRPLTPLPFEYVVELSCSTKAGLEALHAAIDKLIWQNGAPKREELVITSLRHKEALEIAHQSLRKVILGLEGGISAEFVAFDMREALIALGTIIGTNITEDVLTSIFQKFCIGK